MNRLLIAGIGNTFLGDDSFGIEVAKELARGRLPEGACVFEFGIRTSDLAYTLTDDYDAVIFVDATPRGHLPGTVYLIEPDLNRLRALERHGVASPMTNPVFVSQLAESLGQRAGRLFLVGCEPDPGGRQSNRVGLSPVAREAVPRVVELIKTLLSDLLVEEPEPARMAA